MDFGNPSLNSVHQSGWLFGGFVGAQKQWGNWVIGIEADFDGANIKGSATSSISSPSIACVLGTRDDCSVTRSLSIDSKIDELGSVRSKSGWAFAPNWLVYYTSGIAFAHVKETVNLTQTTNYDLQTYTGTATASGGLSMLGWALGAGLDWKWPVDAGSAWVLGIEYVHYQFPSDTLTIADNQFGSGSSLGISTRQSVDTVKARISYFFSIH